MNPINLTKGRPLDHDQQPEWDPDYAQELLAACPNASAGAWRETLAGAVAEIQRLQALLAAPEQELRRDLEALRVEREAALDEFHGYAFEPHFTSLPDAVRKVQQALESATRRYVAAERKLRAE